MLDSIGGTPWWPVPAVYYLIGLGLTRKRYMSSTMNVKTMLIENKRRAIG
jgi:hypothetical protein